jgi:inward rectifier potassium channel
MSILAGFGATLEMTGSGKYTVILLAGIWQMVSLAVFIALLVDRLTTPHARIVFSNVAVLGSFNGQPALTFRLAHERTGVLVEASVRVFMYIK